MTTLPDIDTLASEFTIIIREWLTPEQCREIDRRNAESRAAGDHSVCHSHDFCDSSGRKLPVRMAFDHSVCHSHDFCDANQAMLDAMERFNIELDLQDESQVALINAAWDKAKLSGFGTPAE